MPCAKTSSAPSGDQDPGVAAGTAVTGCSMGPLRSAGTQEMPFFREGVVDRNVTRFPSGVHTGAKLKYPEVSRDSAPRAKS
jgi:hypothetical protein